MCFYIQKIYQYDVLRMKCEFTRDENGTIWFVYASDIYAQSNVHALKAKKALQLQQE